MVDGLSSCVSATFLTWINTHSSIRSYILTSKRGNRSQFKNMINSCHAAGVKVIAGMWSRLRCIAGRPFAHCEIYFAPRYYLEPHDCSRFWCWHRRKLCVARCLPLHNWIGLNLFPFLQHSVSISFLVIGKIYSEHWDWFGQHITVIPRHIHLRWVIRKITLRGDILYYYWHNPIRTSITAVCPLTCLT